MSRYLRAELRHSVGSAPWLGLGAGLALIGASQWIIPRVPEGALRVLERSYQLQGLGEVLLLNDLLALGAVLFFVGASQLHRVLVAPREERQLDLLLSKPVTRERFLLARTLPVLGATLLLGVVLSAACALAMAPYAGGRVGPGLGLAAGLGVTATTIAQLALANLLHLRTRDGFQALLASFGLWILPLLPTSVYLYRPDLFEARPGLASWVVAPVNWLWLGEQAGLVAGLGLLAAGLLAAGSAWLGGRALARAEG